MNLSAQQLHSKVHLRLCRNACTHAMHACNVYVSEGRDEDVIRNLQSEVEEHMGVALVNTFMDRPYHRTGFTLASNNNSLLGEAAVRLAHAALAALDLRKHNASHPRLGTVDHISCHPLTPAAGLQDTAALAQQIGTSLGSGGNPAPVFLYGAAHSSNRGLADLRRALGYFSGSSGGKWRSSISLTSAPPSCPPDFGPALIDTRTGIIAIGATPWVVNYNILLHTADMRSAQRIAKAVSERGGGLPGVQAMALPHEKGTEIACNLLHDGEGGIMERVYEAVQKLAAADQISLGEAYRIGRSAEEYAKLASEQLHL